MVNRLGAGTKVGQLGIWDGTQWVAGDPDCNIVKWGGTALTGRDISLDLAKLNVNLDTRARLQPWYQPNFTTSNKAYAQGTVAPHGWTTRWTYTVPASRIAIVRSASAFAQRDGAPTTAGVVNAIVTNNNIAESCRAGYVSATVGATDSKPVGEGSVLVAGDQFTGQTLDLSTGGTNAFIVTANIMVFDT